MLAVMGRPVPALPPAGSPGHNGALYFQGHFRLMSGTAHTSSKSTGKSGPNRLRIIGGDWRSRVLTFAAVPDLRPTPDRVRETLFNWLQTTIVGARCLDLFAGSGALGFEALSRGATSVVALELDPKAVAAIRANAQALNTDKLELLQKSAVLWLQKNQAAAQFDVVFVDPPYQAGLYQPCLELLQQQQWLAPGALLYVEAEQSLDTLGLPQAWELWKHKRAGGVHFGLFRLAHPAQA